MKFENINVGDKLVVTNAHGIGVYTEQGMYGEILKNGRYVTVVEKLIFGDYSRGLFVSDEEGIYEDILIFEDELDCFIPIGDSQRSELTLPQLMQLHMEIEDNLRENTINLMLDQRDFKSLKRYVY